MQFCDAYINKAVRTLGRQVLWEACTCGGAFMATTMPATTGTSSMSGFMTMRHTPLICTWSHQICAEAAVQACAEAKCC